jgi:lambda family phage portal protein
MTAPRVTSKPRADLPAPRVTLLDRMIATVSPNMAVGRVKARMALDAVRQYGVARTGGRYRGTLSNWMVHRNSAWTEGRERETIANRAEDLFANDPHAASVIDSMAVNTVGTGIVPQSVPHHRVLGISEDAARDLGEQCEWCYTLWCREADARGTLPFWGIQLLSVYSLLVRGEFFRLPVMLSEPGRTFSLALQCIDPVRMATPTDLIQQPRLRDGVELSALGRPEAYWIANPENGQITTGLSSASFTRVSARAAHRTGAFHIYIAKTEEQVRGHSVLAPAMKFFRDLSDYLDYELVGAIVASSFPVFIEEQNPWDMGVGLDDETDADNPKLTYGSYSPGQVLYGARGQKPHVLKSERPGGTFPAFVERILRAVGAAVGMPYEVIAKDFSKTNYSSARAALLEAWKVFRIYQRWMVDCFCQPVWEMVLEEAWLRGMITLPKGAPDWYAARAAYTRAQWVPPRRGHVDPEKEIKSYIRAKDHNMMTLAEIIAELTGLDWVDVMDQRGRERQTERNLDIVPPENEEEEPSPPEPVDEEPGRRVEASNAED